MIKEVVPENPVADAISVDKHTPAPEQIVVEVMVGRAVLGIEAQVDPVAQAIGQGDRNRAGVQCAGAELTVLKSDRISRAKNAVEMIATSTWQRPVSKAKPGLRLW